MERRRVCATGLIISAGILTAILTFMSCNPDEEVLTVDGSWKAFNTGNGLPSNLVKALAEDRDGNIWIGTVSGLAKYDGKTFTEYDDSDIPFSDNINAVAADINGYVWVGTDKVLNILINGEFQYYEELIDIEITAIAADNSGVVWVGTWGSGVIKFADFQHPTQIFDNACNDCNFVSAIHVDQSNNVWAATYGGQVKRLSPNPQSFSNGLPGTYLSALGSDRWGRVWVGSDDGTNVSRFNGSAFEEFPLGNFYLYNSVWALAEDGAGNMWVGMGYHGLLQYDGVTFRRVANDPPGEDCTALLRDRYGNLWVGTFDYGLYYHVVE